MTNRYASMDDIIDKMSTVLSTEEMVMYDNIIEKLQTVLVEEELNLYTELRYDIAAADRNYIEEEQYDNVFLF